LDYDEIWQGRFSSEYVLMNVFDKKSYFQDAYAAASTGQARVMTLTPCSS